MKRYMTVLFMALVALLLASVSNNVFAQTVANKTSANVAPTADQAQTNARIASELERESRFGYQDPGNDPVVVEHEIDKAIGNHIEVGQMQMISFWGDGKHGEFDDATLPGLLPISQRLTERFYQLLECKDEVALTEELNNLRNGHFTNRVYEPAKMENGKLVVPGPQPELPEIYGSKGVGKKTAYPPTPIGFRLHALLLAPVRATCGIYAGTGVSLAITTMFETSNGLFKKPCLNFTGEFGDVTQVTAPVPETPNVTETKSVTATTNTAPPPPPPSSQASATEFRPAKDWGYNVDFGVEFDFGIHQSAYSGAALPGTGDATQHNNYRAIRPVVRIEPKHGSGPVVSGDITVLDKTGPKTFDDPVTKIRDTDKTQDTNRQVFGGYQFNLGGVDLAAIVGLHQICMCEDYTGQGAATKTQRAYKLVEFGAQTRFDVAQNATLRLRGTYGRGNRTQWTQQTYPGVTFPRVDQPKASASSVNLRAEVAARLMGPLGVIATYDFTHLSSTRTNTFAAHESVTLHTFAVGVVVHIGK